jgi:hypothetical protein
MIGSGVCREFRCAFARVSLKEESIDGSSVTEQALIMPDETQGSQREKKHWWSP